MLLEEERFIHEDLERLEQGIADRISEEPRNIRERLNRDHQIAGFLSRIQEQSKRLYDIYKDTEGLRSKEILTISTGEPFNEFYKQLGDIKDFHQRYPNEQVENLERAYKRKAPVEGESMTAEVDNMFTGEEAFGRYLDLNTIHEEFLNLPNNKRLSYLQYLQVFDKFSAPQMPLKRADKRTDQYFVYLGHLAEYLESFSRRTRPMDDLDKEFAAVDTDFGQAWEKNEIAEWNPQAGQAGPIGPSAQSAGESMYCADCEKDFKNGNVYKAHLTGKKHTKAAEARKAQGSTTNGAIDGDRNGATSSSSIQRLKDRAIAEREFRIKRLASTLDTIRSDTRINVERKQGMTERERQMELEALYAEEDAAYATAAASGAQGYDSDSDGEEKIYNPLKLPLAWDGKPIPFWLYKLHGLGVEYSCEICGNFVYMGRRAFDKHFTEARHIYGLKCLGITNTTMFREITGIGEALKLWDKIQRDKRSETSKGENVVQMEDAEGNVMPEKVYYDLQKQGLL